MQFLYPIGLLALAGLIIPLIIHLWNVEQGKTLKIGSIALLGESAKASSKSFKINDWLLFILRCLFLILIAFIIAQPFIQKIVSSKNKGWILVEKSNIPKVFIDNKKTIDSLIKLGYEIHDFNVEFALINLKDTTNADNLKKLNKLNYSELLSEVNNIIPANTPVYLFAKHRLINIGNNLPEIAYKLNWRSINQTDTLSNWISDYAGKKYDAKSNPSNTVYSALNPNDAPSIKIAIHESLASNDKKYLIAALNAIGSFSGRKIEINTTEKVDIGFWLTDEPVSASFKSSIDTNGTLFQYEKGKVISESSFIKIDGKNVLSNKRIESKQALEKIWSDGFGNVILSAEKLKHLNILHFYSRLNPQWNELVWNDLFVKALMPIIIHDNKSQDFGFEDNQLDQRQFASNQKEIIQLNKETANTKQAINKPINNIFWFIAFLILVTERILSFRKKTSTNVKN